MMNCGGGFYLLVAMALFCSLLPPPVSADVRQCYVCNEPEGGKCGNREVTNCQSGQICGKGETDDKKIARECSPSTYAKGGKMDCYPGADNPFFGGGEAKFKTICYCDTELCNSAPSAKIPVVSIFTMSLLALVYLL